MRHDPERLAAAYLFGEMPGRKMRRYELHLLECSDCWSEVKLGRLGRSAAESARELAPQRLRELVRAEIDLAPKTQDRVRGRRATRVGLGMAALVIAMSIVLVAVDQLRGGQSQPRAIAAAVADFKDGRLPVAFASTDQAPDLSKEGLRLEKSGAGKVDLIEVDAFQYRADSGAKVLLYRSRRPFPVASGAHRSSRPEGPWTAEADGVSLLCAQHPYPILVLSTDERLLKTIARALPIVGG